jgi:HAD superfamily hydrolase (TIGR01490 family)
MALAIFDLDNTLIAGDSDYLWGKFLIEKGAVHGETFEAENERFYALYQQGTLDIMEYQRFSLKPLTQFDMVTLHAWREEFMQTVIQPIFLPKAQQLVDHHRNLGNQLMVITATNSFVTRPIAQLYGIDELIGTDPEIIEGRFTGEVVGTPSFQQGKVVRLEAWLKEHAQDLRQSYFYSDSHNDQPLLERVDHPFAVDADPTLKKIAAEKGWPLMSLR